MLCGINLRMPESYLGVEVKELVALISGRLVKELNMYLKTSKINVQQTSEVKSEGSKKKK
jgi:hypothetical protein